MKIIVTGSLGNISKPLAEELIQKGHTVTVISSKPEKQKEIEALGAIAAIGTLEDVDFLTAVFTGADAAYCMTPPSHTIPDYTAYSRRIARSYAQAIRQSGVIKRIVHLSSYGADLDNGTGLVLGKYYAEGILNELPGVSITHMRPVYFYYNLFNFIPMIRSAGVMRANYGGNDSIAMVSPIDIAAAVAEDIVTIGAGRKVQYIASDELTGNEIARILGEAIGIPDLKWQLIPSEQMLDRLKTNGVPAEVAANLVEMFGSLHDGVLSEDYYRNVPAVMGKVKLTDFAKDFAAAYKVN